MSAAARIVVFAGALAVVFAVSAAIGRALDVAPRSFGEQSEAHRGVGAAGTAAPAGLSVEEGGVRLVPARTTLAEGGIAPFAFRLEDERGDAVTDTDVVHERRMHLIVVRRDLTGFQHLHPQLRPDGTWSTALRLPTPGSYRAFADFETGGERRTLGVDLDVPGSVAPRSRPAPSATARLGPYVVSLARDGSLLRFRVARDGSPVLPEPYLGARGHLVVLREGDLAFVHAHPESGATVATGTAYEVELPSAGRYAVYLQFVHEGRLRTARFTIEDRP